MPNKIEDFDSIYGGTNSRAKMELLVQQASKGGVMVEKMKPLPEYGDHMTMDEFIKCVETGGFIDYDGHGHYATETEMLSEPSIDVLPSMVKEGTIDKRWTHIVWFNK
jgi:hypothetical protein